MQPEVHAVPKQELDPVRRETPILNLGFRRRPHRPTSRLVIAQTNGSTPRRAKCVDERRAAAFRHMSEQVAVGRSLTAQKPHEITP
ncbi:MAG: hypothetical protein R3B96_00685 [Pirellulaceae bacterium]